MSNEERQVELKPCPFCGSKDIQDIIDGIQCRDCGAMVIDAGMPRHEAWNRRALNVPQESEKCGWPDCQLSREAHREGRAAHPWVVVVPNEPPEPSQGDWPEPMVPNPVQQFPSPQPEPSGKWGPEDEVGQLGPGEMFNEGGMIYFSDLSPEVQAALTSAQERDTSAEEHLDECMKLFCRLVGNCKDDLLHAKTIQDYDKFWTRVNERRAAFASADRAAKEKTQ